MGGTDVAVPSGELLAVAREEIPVGCAPPPRHLVSVAICRPDGVADADQKVQDVAQCLCAPLVAVVGRQQEAASLSRQAGDHVVVAVRQSGAVFLPSCHQTGRTCPYVGGVYLGGACQQAGVSAVCVRVQPRGQQQVTDRGRAGLGGRRDGRREMGVPEGRVPGVGPGASGVQQGDAGVSGQQ